MAGIFLRDSSGIFLPFKFLVKNWKNRNGIGMN
jgi:hypothetical protein